MAGDIHIEKLEVARLCDKQLPNTKGLCHDRLRQCPWTGKTERKDLMAPTGNASGECGYSGRNQRLLQQVWTKAHRSLADLFLLDLEMTGHRRLQCGAVDQDPLPLCKHQPVSPLPRI